MPFTMKQHFMAFGGVSGLSAFAREKLKKNREMAE